MTFRCLVTACVVGFMGIVANAEVLISEGCDTASDYAGAAASGSGLLGSFPKAFTTSVGLAGGKWSGYGSQPRAFARTLPLPEGFESKGDACVGMNRGSNATAHRWAYLQLMEGKLKVPVGTTLYFRGLISIDKGAATMLTTASNNTIGSGNSFGFCLVPRPGTYGAEGGTPIGLANNIGFYYWKNSTGKQSLSVRVTDAAKTSQSQRLMDDISTPTTDGPNDGNTYICYAEIKVGAGTDGKEVIRAGTSLVSEYNPSSVTWSDPIEAEIISETAYPTHLAIVGDYCVNGWALMDEFVVGTELSDVLVANAAGSPKLTDATLDGGSGAYTAGASLSLAAATDAGVAAHDGSGIGVKLSAGAVALDGDTPVPFEKSFTDADLAADKTYEIYVYAENDVAMVSNAVGTVYTGPLTLTKVCDANEYQLKPGEVMVSRANADPYPLLVNYTLTSTVEGAAAGKTWETPVAVMIPAGETSATLTLKPIVDATVSEDITVTLSLTEGNYPAGSQTVDLTLVNLVPPAGYNTWVAAKDGLASEASNWSMGVPKATDQILFDGNFSSANCTWDAETDGGPAMTVASWTQRDGYAGKVVVATKYPETSSLFTTFTVTGDMLIDCGGLTQVANDIQKEEYRLNLVVGGDLTVGSAGTIDVTGCGPRGVLPGRTANVYAGDYNVFQKTYGDPKRPYYCGSGNDGAWPSYYKGAGGGAVWIEVAGTATVKGAILSEGSVLNSNMDVFDGKTGNITTSGGSVYLKAAVLAGDGNGRISAKSEYSCNLDNQIGSGGRVAIELTATAYDFETAAVKITANANAKQAGSPGHGTIVIRNPGEENGTLYVLGKYDRTFSYNNCEYTRNQTTSIPAGQIWTFDKVVVGDFGMISVGPDTTLSLPNGWQSVYSKNTASVTDYNKKYACGIIDRGGTFDVPAQNGKHAFKNGNWTFHPTNGYVLDADTEVSGGASLGAMYLSATNTTVLACDVKVAGNLDIKSDGVMNANWGGIGGTGPFANGHYSPFIGNELAQGTGHGGQNALADGNDAYGSFFSPMLPGTASGHADLRYVGGGIIKLEVTGTLNVDGVIQSCSGWNNQYWSDRPSAPGSINITAGALTGSGAIKANGAAGYVGTYPKTSWKTQGPSGGGRVAVRLTGAAATFTDEWVANITAKGVSASGTLKPDTANTNVLYSSAGSVYLQTAAQGEKCGTIIICNDNQPANTAYTPLPADAEADDVRDFRKAELLLTGCGRVRFYDNVTIGHVSLDEGSVIDLNGQEVIASRVKLGSVKLASGTYTADLLTTIAEGYVVDSVGGGTLTLSGDALMIVIH